MAQVSTHDTLLDSMADSDLSARALARDNRARVKDNALIRLITALQTAKVLPLHHPLLMLGMTLDGQLMPARMYLDFFSVLFYDLRWFGLPLADNLHFLSYLWTSSTPLVCIFFFLDLWTIVRHDTCYRINWANNVRK